MKFTLCILLGIFVSTVEAVTLFGHPDTDWMRFTGTADNSVIFSPLSGALISYGEPENVYEANLRTLTRPDQIKIYNSTLQENSDGSVKLLGSIDVGTQVGLFVDSNFYVEYIFDSAGFRDFIDGLTTFNVYSLDSNVCTDSALCDETSIGTIDYFITNSFLAGVANTFPNYSPVPLPAAAWLFLSALAGLVGIRAKKR